MESLTNNGVHEIKRIHQAAMTVYNKAENAGNSRLLFSTIDHTHTHTHTHTVLNWSQYDVNTGDQTM